VLDTITIQEASPNKPKREEAIQMKKEIVDVRSAGFKPSPIASHCVKFGNLVFPAGQVPVDPKTGKVVENDIQPQTRQCLENLKSVLTLAGSSLENLLKVNCYLRNMDDFDRFNEVYMKYFPSMPPARTTIQAARLWDGILIEIEAVGCIPD
jgi:2-iminobutanoate/2-iminopropanoate deaminase